MANTSSPQASSGEGSSSSSSSLNATTRTKTSTSTPSTESPKLSSDQQPSPSHHRPSPSSNTYGRRSPSTAATASKSPRTSASPESSRAQPNATSSSSPSSSLSPSSSPTTSARRSIDPSSSAHYDPSIASSSSHLMGSHAHRVLQNEGDDDLDPIDLASSSESNNLASHEEASFLEQVESNERAASTPTHDFKKVKVYELRNEAWFDRGTGHVHGLYDEDTDQALLLVTAEHVPLSHEESLKQEEEKRAKMELDAADQGGGFLLPEEEDRDAGLGNLPVIKGIRSKGVEGRVIMHSLVQAKDVYQRQQDTLIVWTEPNGTDIALSFAEADDCENVWEFVTEVQKMLATTSEDVYMTQPNLSSSPDRAYRSDSPVFFNAAERREKTRIKLTAPTLSSLQNALAQVKSLSKTSLGREKVVEAVMKDGYIKVMIESLSQAEDLESVDDLHILHSLMQTILFCNDATVLEYVMQDDLFLGVIGMLEYDPEYPKLKASHREFISNSSHFRQAVEIKDAPIRDKIHQTFRLQYLKDVVLVRSLEDSTTFNILNPLIFYNQSDIIQHIQSNDDFLERAFASFHPPAWDKNSRLSDIAVDPQREGVVLLLHQLLLMSKNIALPSRLQLVRTLLDHGLVLVLEWAFSYHPVPPSTAPRPSSTSNPSTDPSTSSYSLPSNAPPSSYSADHIKNPAVEMLAHALDHDPAAVRSIVIKENDGEEGGTTMVVEMIRLLLGEGDILTERPLISERQTGVKGQLAEALKQLLDTGDSENSSAYSRGPAKDGPVAEKFVSYFYEHCVDDLMKPLFDLPDYKSLKGQRLRLNSDDALLCLYLTDLLSFFVSNHGHRSQYFILSGPMNTKVGSLLTAREKPLRHAAIRFFRACLRINNHFMIRYLNKGDVFAPILELAASQSPKDNMLSSACLELFDYMRKENIKDLINNLMDHHGERIRALSNRPVTKACMVGLVQKWEQNNEPPPVVDVRVVEEDAKRKASREEDSYWDESDESDTTPPMPSTSKFSSTSLPTTQSSLSLASLGPGPKRKRQKGQLGDAKTTLTRTSSSSSSSSFASSSSSAGSKVKSKGLDLGYDDDSSDEDSPGFLPSEPLIGPVLGDPLSSSQGSRGVATGTNSEQKKLDSPEKIEGVTQRMSEKRRREEEEEDVADGLMSLLGGGSSGSSRQSTGSSTSSSSRGHKRNISISSAPSSSSSSVNLLSTSTSDPTNASSSSSIEPRPLPEPPQTAAGGSKEEAEKPKGKLSFSLKGFKLGGRGGSK